MNTYTKIDELRKQVAILVKEIQKIEDEMTLLGYLMKDLTKAFAKLEQPDIDDVIHYFELEKKGIEEIEELQEIKMIKQKRVKTLIAQIDRLK